MEKQIAIMKQSIELLETVIEGLAYIQRRMNEGFFEDTIHLYQDTVMAFSVIENSLNALPNDLISQDVDHFITSVRNAMEIAVSSYEDKNYAKVQAVLQFTLIPSCKRWKIELEEAFNSYLVS